jgi:hypothetical protein
MIARPKLTEQDRQMMMEAQEQQRCLQGDSAVDEVAKLAKLRDEGKITAEEYESMEQRALSYSDVARSSRLPLRVSGPKRR